MEEEKEELRRKRNREYNRLYRERNREKVYQNNKAYREKHPELFRAYYHKHKERITTRRKEIVHCDCCNIDLTLESMYRHKYSLGHLENEIITSNDSELLIDVGGLKDLKSLTF